MRGHLRAPAKPAGSLSPTPPQGGTLWLPGAEAGFQEGWLLNLAIKEGKRDTIKYPVTGAIRRSLQCFLGEQGPLAKCWARERAGTISVSTGRGGRLGTARQDPIESAALSSIPPAQTEPGPGSRCTMSGRWSCATDDKGCPEFVNPRVPPAILLVRPCPSRPLARWCARVTSTRRFCLTPESGALPGSGKGSLRLAGVAAPRGSSPGATPVSGLVFTSGMAPLFP